MKGLLDRLHEMVFDEEEKPAGDLVKIPAPGPWPDAPAPPVVVLDDSQIFQGLLAKTSTDSCPNLQKYYAMAGTLKAAISDETTRSKAAVAASGVTVELMGNELAGLREKLKTECERVGQKLDEAQKQLVSESEKEAAELEREIDQKSAQLRTLKTNIATADNKVKQKRVDFQAAVARRSAELDEIGRELSRIR